MFINKVESNRRRGVNDPYLYICIYTQIYVFVCLVYEIINNVYGQENYIFYPQAVMTSLFIIRTSIDGFKIFNYRARYVLF